MLPYLRQIGPTRLAIFLILAVTLFRLWFSTQLGLVADEAYYWLWSKHLAASYRDKGPAIAWTIALGTQLFGDTVFGIRFFAVLLGSGIGWLLFDLARRLYDPVTGLWCLLMALTMPLLTIGSILMTIDSLSVFFWALAIIIFWNALQSGKGWHWFWLGLAIGAGFLAKFTNGVQLVCIAMFLHWSKEHRRRLWSRNFIITIAAFSLASLPIIWWNVQTGWVHAIALHSRSGVSNTFQIHPQQLLRFVGEQFGVISPLFMAGMVISAVGLLLTRRDDLRTRFLLSQYLPVYGLFMFFSLNSAGLPNWIAPALIPGIVFTVVSWRELLARQPIWRWGVIVAFIVASAMTLALHNSEPLHLPRQLDPLHRAQGWEDFGAHVQAVRGKHRANLLLGDDYAIASLMAFYLPDQPTTHMPPAPYGSSQFTLWAGYAVTPDTRALYLTAQPQDAPESLQKQFSKIDLVEDFWTQHHGRPMNHYCIYLCTQK